MKRRAIDILLPAAAYLAFGKLSQLLFLSAGHPNLIWPPAGVALAALVLLGCRAWLGVALGACWLGIEGVLTASGPSSPWPRDHAVWLAVGMGLGAAAQAAVGAWLVRRYVGSPGALDRARDVALFVLFGGMVGCLISPLVGAGLLCLAGKIPPHGCLESFGVWWLGDVLGVICVAPVVFTLFATPRPVWRRRRLLLSLPLVACLGLLVASSGSDSDSDTARIAGVLQHEAERVVDALERRVAIELEGMRAVASLLRASDEAGEEPREEMDEALLLRFIARQEAHGPVVQGPWAPRGAPAGTAAPDAPSSAGGLGGELQRARVYLAVHSPAGQESAVRPLGSIPGGIDAAIDALSRGQAAITAPMELMVEGRARRGVLVLWPVLAAPAPARPIAGRTAPAETAVERLQRLRAFVAGPVLVDALAEDTPQRLARDGLASGDVAGGLSVRLQARTGPARAVVLYARESSAARAPGLLVAAHREVAGLALDVELAPSVALVRAMRSWDEPVHLVSDLLLAALLGALLLLVTGHGSRIEAAVAEHAEAQGILRQSAFLRRLVDANVIGILVTDAQGGVYEANDAFLDMIGYSRAELVEGRICWAELTPAEHLPQDMLAKAQLEETGIAGTWDKEYVRKDGTRVPVMVGVVALDGFEDRQVAFVTDLTRIKQAEAEQNLLTERLAALIDAIPDVIFRLSRDGVYLEYKNSRNHWLLADADALIGTSLLDDPLPAEVKQHYMAAIEGALATGAVQEFEYSLESPQGMRHYEARVVKSGRGEVAALVRDITDARRTRDALEEAIAGLRAANGELREFASVASHDLQEPLRTVRSFVDLLEKRYGDVFDDRGRKWLAHIVSGTARMRSLIDDLLAYSRVGRTDSHEPVDTAVLVDEILEDAHASIAEAGAEVEVGALPTVTANRTELRQVFQNLVSNALKFRRPEVAPRVVIAAEQVPGGWAFSVADNGIGIDAAYHERIFQVFQRLHGRDEYPGTGIGLALVKKIIERQGGEISIHSTPGEGTTFRFVLPARPRRQAMKPAEGEG